MLRIVHTESLGHDYRGVEKNYIIRSLMICTPHQILCGWSNREEWDGRGM